MTRCAFLVGLLCVSCGIFSKNVEGRSISDWASLLTASDSMSQAQGYLTNALAKPLDSIRSTICSPDADLSSMVANLKRATNSPPENLQDALGLVTKLTKQVMEDPQYKPQMENLQKQMQDTLKSLNSNFEKTVGSMGQGVGAVTKQVGSFGKEVGDMAKDVGKSMKV